LSAGERAAASGSSVAQPKKTLRTRACIVLLETVEIANQTNGYGDTCSRYLA
jgi:hypothetical protein